MFNLEWLDLCSEKVRAKLARYPCAQVRFSGGATDELLNEVNKQLAYRSTFTSNRVSDLKKHHIALHKHYIYGTRVRGEFSNKHRQQVTPHPLKSAISVSSPPM